MRLAIAEGELARGTTGDNPVKFRAPTGHLQASLQFDAPLTRLLERNNFRQAIIDYQRDRRQLIQFEDSVDLTLRGLLRQLEQQFLKEGGFTEKLYHSRQNFKKTRL